MNTRSRRGIRDPEARFALATTPGVPSAHRPELGPCLMYTGADNGNGYGQFTYHLFGRRGQYAHRYAWERTNGKIPDGLTVDHLCRVRLCVNVSHFELVPGVENYLRAAAIRTHCANGHPYRQSMVGAGNRRCLICLEAQVKRGSERRTNTYRGLPDRRIRYDQVAKARLVDKVALGEMTISDAATELGCAPKYMDKCARRRRRELGLPDRRPRQAS